MRGAAGARPWVRCGIAQPVNSVSSIRPISPTVDPEWVAQWPDPLVRVGPSGELVQVNRAARALFRRMRVEDVRREILGELACLGGGVPAGKCRRCAVEQWLPRTGRMSSLTGARFLRMACMRWRGSEDRLVQITDLTLRAVAPAHRKKPRSRLRDLASPPSLRSILRSYMATLLKIRGVDGVGIYLQSPSTGGIELAAHRGLGRDFARAVARFDAGSSVVRLLLADRVVRRACDYTARWALYRDAGLRSFVAVPVRFHRQAIASINVGSRSLAAIPEAIEAAVVTLSERLGMGLALAREADALRTAHGDLKARMDRETLIRGISARFVRVPGHAMDAAIRQSIGEMARHLDVPRGMFCRYSDDQRSFLAACEWCARPEAAASALQGRQPRERYPWARAQLRQGRPLLIDDVRLLPAAAAPERRLSLRVGIRASLTVPVFLRRQMIGCLSFHDLHRPRVWSDDDVHLAVALADTIARAVERHDAELMLRRRVAVENLIQRISARFVTLRAVSPDQAIETSLREMGRFLGVQMVGVFQYSDDRTRMRMTHDWRAEGVRSERAGSPDLPLAGFRWLSRRILSGRATVVHSVRDLPPAAAAERSMWARAGHLSVVCLPLMAAGRAWGTLGFSVQRQARRWTEEDLRIGRIVGGLIANTLAQRRSEDALKRQLSVEDFVVRASARFVAAGPEDTERAITDTFREMGVYLGVDRCFLCRNSDDLGESRVEYEWCAPGRSRMMKDHASASGSAFPHVDRLSDERRPLVVHRWSDLPSAAAAERRFCRAHKVQSLLAVPVFVQGRRFAQIELHAVRRARVWRESDVRLVGLVGEMIAHTLHRKAAIEALGHSESRYRAITEEAMDAVFLIDPAGTISDVNAAGCALFGLPRDRMVGVSSRRLFSTVSRPILKQMGEAIRVGQGVATTLFFTGPRGDSRAVEVRARRLQDGRVLALARDVTERRQLERELLTIASREKQRIGRDLHDTLGQQLTGAAYLSAALERRLRGRAMREAEAARSLQHLLQKAVAHTRYVAHGMAPVEIAGQGLSEALRNLAAETASTFGLACRFADRGGAAGVTDLVVARELYQIALEAVHNAVRHGHPRHVTIELSGTKTGGCLAVTDDGRWREPNRRKDRSGIGLRMMRYRAEMIAGHVEVRRHHGTRVECTFSLRAAAPPAERRGT